MNFFSVSTFKNLWREEPTFKHEVYATVVLLPLAWLWVGLSLEWRIGLTAAWAFVMVVEALNRALCAVIDAIFIDYHPLLQRAKHLGTLAVSIALLFNVLIWVAAILRHS